jgi:hypothetical protein
MKAMMNIHQEKMEVQVRGDHQVSGGKHPVVLTKPQGLRKEMAEKIDETQVYLQAIRTSVDMLTKSLLETITDTREHFHEELSLMIQVGTQMVRTLVDTTR